MDWTSFDWRELIAALINSVLVIGVVQIVKLALPIIKKKMPMLFPLLALFIGPLMTTLQNAVSSQLGFVVDLSPLVGVLTGGTAVAFHQIKSQASKGVSDEKISNY
jgi:hypothetical protein